MEDLVSIIIPVYNGAETIKECLEAVYLSSFKKFEVIVVDDGSVDNTVEVVQTFPCRLIRLDHQTGRSKARNMGAENSKGEVLFFTDVDCIFQKETILLASQTMNRLGKNSVLGGTYSWLPVDNDFFSTFQSIFIHYFECKNLDNPDYIAAHALIIKAETFKQGQGFSEDFLAMIEDVEFSHRLKKSGCSLRMNSAIQVRHIFNFTFWKSLINAYNKTKYWIVYSMGNRDLLADSGTASKELKFNVVSFLAVLLVLILSPWTGSYIMVAILACILSANFLSNKNLFLAFYSVKGGSFLFKAVLFYCFFYPIPIVLGVASGIAKYFWARFSKQ